MINRELLALLTPEDMPSDELRIMAQIIGVEKTVQLILRFVGTRLYFPTHWQKNFVQKWVSHRFDGENQRALTKELGVSMKTIERALKQKPVRTAYRKPPDPGRANQLDIFSPRSTP